MLTKQDREAAFLLSMEAYDGGALIHPLKQYANLIEHDGTLPRLIPEFIRLMQLHGYGKYIPNHMHHYLEE